MSFDPEQGILFKLNGTEFVLSPEVEGRRFCVRLDADSKGIGVGPDDRSNVVATIYDVFQEAEDPVPRISFAEFPSEAFEALRAFAIQHAASDYSRQSFGPYRMSFGKQQPEAGRTLDWFARRFSGETRERISAAAGDLRKDVRDLRAEGASRWRVRWECLATTTTTLGPIIFDRLARIIRAVMSVVREFDGPRPS